MNEASSDPGTWRLDEFPQPNPYFPETPRPAKGWTWRGLAVFAGMFVGSLGTIILMIAYYDEYTVPYDLGPVVAIVLVLGVVVGALGTPLAAYNVWRLHSWRYGEIVPVRIVRARRGGSITELLFHLVIKFIPIVGYLVWLSFGGQSAKVAYLARGTVRTCGAVCEDEGPQSGETVWMVKPSFPYTARLLVYAWGADPELVGPPPPEVIEWLDRALARSGTEYTRTAGGYTRE